MDDGGARTENIDRLFSTLAEQLSNGWMYFLTAKHLHNAFESGRVTCARMFFLAAYQASLDRSIAVVQEVVYGEEALLPRLLQAAGAGPDLFAQAAPGSVRERADSCSALLAGLNGQIEQLVIARSRLPELREGDPVDADLLASFSSGQLMGLQKAYRDVLRMVDEFSGYYTGPAPDLAFVEETVSDDIAFLMDTISGNCI